MDITAHHDKIIGTFDRIGSREKTRASEAGEDREEIGSMIELTGLNKKAVSFTRALHKMEADKRADVLRSLKPLLEMMEGHWDGQKTPDMFDPTADAVEPAEVPAPPRKPSYEPDPDLQEEADDFDKHLAEVAG